MPFRTRGTPPEHVKMSGELRVMQRLSEYEFGVELWVMRSGLNDNNWDFRNMREHYLTFVGQPILCAYVGRKVGDGHNMREVRDPYTGEKGYTFMDGTAERIVGTLSDDPRDFSIVEEDGNEWIRAKGRLFQFYAPELVGKSCGQGAWMFPLRPIRKIPHGRRYRDYYRLGRSRRNRVGRRCAAGNSGGADQGAECHAGRV